MMDRELTWKANVIFTIAFMYVPSLVAFVYPDVNDWVCLLGAFCNSTLGVLFPALIGYKYWTLKLKKKKESSTMYNRVESKLDCIQEEEGITERKMKVSKWLYLVWGFGFCLVM